MVITSKIITELDRQCFDLRYQITSDYECPRRLRRLVIRQGSRRASPVWNDPKNLGEKYPRRPSNGPSDCALHWVTRVSQGAQPRSDDDRVYANPGGHRGCLLRSLRSYRAGH